MATSTVEQMLRVAPSTPSLEAELSTLHPIYDMTITWTHSCIHILFVHV